MLKVGAWTKTAGGSTTTSINLGAQAKAVILWGSGLSAAAFGTWSEGGASCLGFSDGTTNRALGRTTRDNNEQQPPEDGMLMRPSF